MIQIEVIYSNKYLKLAPIEVRAGPKQLPQIVLFIGIRNWGVLK